jgi:hypothetical protein
MVQPLAQAGSTAVSGAMVSSVLSLGLDGDGMGFGVDIGNGESLRRRRNQKTQNAKAQNGGDPHREFPSQWAVNASGRRSLPP